MKKTMIAIAMVSMLGTGCTYSPVDGGVEGVMIYKPWFFGHGGVDSEPITTGAVWTALSTSVVRYNIKPRQYTEKYVDLTASDNVAIDFNSYVTLQINKGKSPILHENYGTNWYDMKIKEPFRTMVRQEARTHSSIALRTDEKTIAESQVTILARLREYIETEKLPIRALKVVIGKVVPPEEVLAEAERTAAQKQREKTQVAKAKTELLRAQAETNAALADKAYANEFGMTTEQFLRNKELDIIASKANVSVVMGVQPFVNIK